jgi:TctA family transporter
MFESLQHLFAGFGIATTVANLLYCLLGAVAGTLVGILRGWDRSRDCPLIR